MIIYLSTPHSPEKPDKVRRDWYGEAGAVPSPWEVTRWDCGDEVPPKVAQMTAVGEG